MKLKAELKQKRPFESLEEEVHLNLVRTADALGRKVSELLKPAGLSRTQYNVLRILRGAGPEGLRCGEIAERMVTRDPDITRLMDRLEKRELIARDRATDDRRAVVTRITPAGSALLASLDGPMLHIHKKLLGHLGAASLRQLSGLLEQARAGE